jgi:hypothetical protein
MSLLGLTEVEFEPEREAWNVYEVSDGTVLRVKSLLLKLFHSNQTEPWLAATELYSGRFQNVIAVKRANPRLRGPEDARPLSPQQFQSQPRIIEEFTALNEEWSNYRLETGGLLKVKLVVTVVERIEGAWDDLNDPLYAVSAVNVIQEIRK